MVAVNVSAPARLVLEVRDLGRHEGRELALPERIATGGLDGALQRLVLKRGAVALLEQGPRHVALAESGQRDLLRGVLDDGLELVGDFFGCDFDRQDAARGRFLAELNVQGFPVSCGAKAHAPWDARGGSRTPTSFLTGT